MDDAEVELELETRGPDHIKQLLAALRADGYELDVLT